MEIVANSANQTGRHRSLHFLEVPVGSSERHHLKGQQRITARVVPVGEHRLYCTVQAYGRTILQPWSLRSTLLTENHPTNTGGNTASGRSSNEPTRQAPQVETPAGYPHCLANAPEHQTPSRFSKGFRDMAKLGNRRWLDEGHVLFWRRATINLAGQHKFSGVFRRKNRVRRYGCAGPGCKGREGAGGTLPKLSL